jgi:hypothetical protein
MRGPLAIDEACKSIMPSLWDTYAKAHDDAQGVLRQLELGFASLDQERRLAPYKKARAALTTRIRSGVKSNEFELWACLAGSLELQRIPASAIDGLEVDYEKRTAAGDGLSLHDLHIRLPAAAPVKRWRKRPSADDVKAAALALATTFQPDDPPTEPIWWAALNAQLGEEVTRAVALNALSDWAPHLKRQPGQKRNRRN